MQKGPLFPIFKRSPSIHKKYHALVASIVLKKVYFNGICALSKKNSQFHAFLCVSSKSQILRVKNQNVTHPNAAKLATLITLADIYVPVRCYGKLNIHIKYSINTMLEIILSFD